MIMYVVDADGSPEGNSRKITLDDLKTFVNTDPTIVPSSEPWRGALLRLSANLTGLATDAVITWNTVVSDTDSFWSAGAPTRLTIPAGITKVRLHAGIAHEALATAGSVSAFFKKGGSFMGSPNMYSSSLSRQGTTGFTTNLSEARSVVLDVVAGNYFEVATVFSMAGQDQVLASVNTFFELEVIEASI